MLPIFDLPIANYNLNNYVAQNKYFIPWRKKYYKLLYSLLLSFISSVECVVKHNNQAVALKPMAFGQMKHQRSGGLKVLKNS